MKRSTSTEHLLRVRISQGVGVATAVTVAVGATIYLARRDEGSGAPVRQVPVALTSPVKRTSVLHPSTTAVRPVRTTSTTQETARTQAPSTTPTLEQVDADPVPGWPIYGPEAGQQEVRAALEMMRGLEDQNFWQLFLRVHPAIFIDAEQYGSEPTIDTIQMNTSELNYYGTDTYNAGINEENARDNIEWVLSSAAHECFQINKYNEWEQEHPNQPAPYLAYGGATIEDEALVYQYEALKAAGATSDMQNYVLSRVDPKNLPTDYWNEYNPITKQIEP